MKGTTGTTPSSGASPTIPPLADAPPPDVADASPAHSIASRVDATGASNIDQLRDIIFGGQMREYERRFAHLEERLAKELADVRGEVRDRVTALEEYVRDEFESITVELRATQQSRAVEERRLSQSIMDTAKGAEERITALSDLLTKEHRDLRAQLLEQTKTVTDDMQRRYADLLALVERDTAELRDGKADRAALSALFMEVALRLRGESVGPVKSVEPARE